MEYLRGVFGVVLRTMSTDTIEDKFRKAMMDAQEPVWSIGGRIEDKAYLSVIDVNIVFRPGCYFLIMLGDKRIFELDHWMLGIDQILFYDEERTLSVLKKYETFFKELGVEL